MQSFTPQQIAQNKRAFRLRHNALVGRKASERLSSALAHLAALVGKANFNPQQPRVPDGPGRGRWMHVEGYAQGRKPGIGHNGGPPLVDPPDIPKKDPGDKASRLAKAKELAKSLAVSVARRSPHVATALAAIEAVDWLSKELPSIRSNLDRPKAMDELIAGARSARPGYHRHHIAEQTAAENDGYSRSMIDGVDNVVSIPIYKHHQITGWYAQPNRTFGMQTPRDYLRGKDWSERVRIGQMAMRKFGVLKP